MKPKIKEDKNKINFLVSASELKEISENLLSQIDILDLKDPSKGSIGSWDYYHIKEAIKLFKEKVFISATLGDIFDNGKFEEKLNSFDNLDLDYIKFGLLSLNNEDLFAKLRFVALEQFKTKLVCVVFVDHKKSLNRVESNLKFFLDCGIKYILLDTFRKDKGSLLDFCNITFLKNFIFKCRKLDIKVGLAGGLKESQVPFLLNLKPSIVGFRSAICQSNKREASISMKNIKKISGYFNCFNNRATERAGA